MSGADRRAEAREEVRAVPGSPARTSDGLPRPMVLAAAVFTLAVIVTAQSIDGPWIYDDGVLILQNPDVHGVERWTVWFTHHLFWADGTFVPGSRMMYWRPLVLASYALDWVVSGAHPAWFHVTNLVWHGLAGALGFLTLRRWLGAGLPAFLGGLLFAIHPAKVESAAWISGRPDLLFAVGVMLALVGLALRLQGRRQGIAMEIVGTVIAYLSKEHAIVLPVLAVVEAWIAAGRPPLVEIGRPQLVAAVAPHVAVAVTYLFGRYLWLGALDAHSALSVSWIQVWLWLEGLGRLSILAVWPSDLSMGQGLMRLDHGRPVFAPLEVVVGGGVLVLAAAVLIAFHRRSPALALAAGLFVALVLPAAGGGAFGNQTIASPRFLYLPVLALSWIVGLAAGIGHSRRRRFIQAAVMVAVVAGGLRAAWRTRDFTSEDRFWAYELRQNPNLPVALEYFSGQALHSGRPRAALAFAHRAFRQGDETMSHEVVALLISHVVEAVLVLTPDREEATLAEVGRFCRDLRRGHVAHLRVPRLGLELRVNPDTIEAARHRRDSRTCALNEARVASRLGRDNEAVALCREVLATDPFWSTTFWHLVVISARAGRFDLGEQVLEVMAARTGGLDVEAYRALMIQARQYYQAWKQAPPVLRRAAAARFYAHLRAWGRAFAEAEPELATPEALPRSAALVVGELAFRAGDAGRARGLLSRHLSSAEVKVRFDAWAREMQWIDPPATDATVLP